MMSKAGRFDDFFNNVPICNLFHTHVPMSYVVVLWTVPIFGSKFFQNFQILIFIVISLWTIYLYLKSTILISGSIKDYIFWPFLTYPIFYAFFRGNYEFFSMGFLALSIAYLVSKNREVKKSFLLFLISVFIKPTTILFIFLFLDEFYKDRKFRIFSLITGFSALIIVLLMVFLIKGDFNENYNYWLFTLKTYQEAYVIGEGGTLFNNAPWGAIKSFLYFNYEYDVAQGNLKQILPQINNINLCILGITSLILALYRSEIWLKTLTISLLTLIISNVSADYRLITLSPVLLLIFSQNHFDYGSKVSSIFIVIILLPKHFINFIVTDQKVMFTVQSILNPILIIILFTISIYLIFIKGNLYFKDDQ